MFFFVHQSLYQLRRHNCIYGFKYFYTVNLTINDAFILDQHNTLIFTGSFPPPSMKSQQKQLSSCLPWRIKTKLLEDWGRKQCSLIYWKILLFFSSISLISYETLVWDFICRITIWLYHLESISQWIQILVYSIKYTVYSIRQTQFWGCLMPDNH